MKIESDDDKLNKPWQKMTTTTFSNTVNDYMASMNERVTAGFDGDDFIRVMWLSFTLFFTVGGYWLLRSIKDPIMSAIDGVDYIPQAKIASLFVIFALVLLCKKFKRRFFCQLHNFYSFFQNFAFSCLFRQLSTRYLSKATAFLHDGPRVRGHILRHRPTPIPSDDWPPKYHRRPNSLARLGFLLRHRILWVHGHTMLLGAG